jgi:hypothetical protein
MRALRSPRGIAQGLAELLTTHAAPVARDRLAAWRGVGDHGAPITTGPDRTVLLFFEDIERDRRVRGDRHLRRSARRVYHALTHGQRVSGFEVAFDALVRALRLAGCRVVVNNYALARQHPEFPVGLAGYPHRLDQWTLPNPAILGPGLLDHPAQRPALMQDPRFHRYLVPCPWMHTLFDRAYPGQCAMWWGGIDPQAWPDLSRAPKDIDLLIYDKLRWNREEAVRTILEPLEARCRARGLRIVRLVRGAYDLTEYRALLARSRGMLFLVEHETQGLAYQEAMACNVPILAFDPGEWSDPNRYQWSTESIAASSVPFFDASCGERFADVASFDAALDRFLAGLDRYAPRAYVARALSLATSASLYLAAYTSAGAAPATPR